MDVIEKARKGWHRWQLFKEIEPGHRFQTRYNNHRQRRETWTCGRIFNVVGGPALIVILTCVVALGYWLIA